MTAHNRTAQVFSSLAVLRPKRGSENYVTLVVITFSPSVALRACIAIRICNEDETLRPRRSTRPAMPLGTDDCNTSVLPVTTVICDCVL